MGLGFTGTKLAAKLKIQAKMMIWKTAQFFYLIFAWKLVLNTYRWLTQHGPITTLIYNAGTGIFKNYEKLSVAELERSFAINTSGLLIAAKLVAPKMVAAG